MQILLGFIHKLEFVTQVPVSTNETLTQETIVYPNPSDGVFSIRTPYLNLKYMVTSLQGNILEQGTLTENKIDISSYPKGIYFLQLYTGKRTSVKKLIVE